MYAPKPDVSEIWIQHQRRNYKATPSWSCIFCVDRRIFDSESNLWEHAKTEHTERLPIHKEELAGFLQSLAEKSAKKKYTEPRKPNLNEAIRAQPEPPPGQRKRALETPGRPVPTGSISGLGALNISTPRGSDDVAMQELSKDGQAEEENLPRKRDALGDGISAGSGSPFRDSSRSPPPHRSKTRPVSGQYGSTSDPDTLPRDMLDTQGRPHVGKRQLWSPGQEAPLTKASFNDPSNIASVQVQKSRAQQLQPRSRKPFQPPPQVPNTRPQISQNMPAPLFQVMGQHPSILENSDIILQPETRPISQEQLVAELKRVHAGLVMVEAKCIEVDNKQATIAKADPVTQPKLNNEQWQALVLYTTLLREHHDFFLASQHPSASPALRKLASKYASPARMWRHGIHTFLELLRHRLSASFHHMLAFIHLAYSMMALLYEPVAAFEDTWIECLGDLGCYRMVIEDDSINDRELWVGVDRYWYLKGSQNIPCGRLYHNPATFPRPNALQPLSYHAKTFCFIDFSASSRKSAPTPFDRVLSTENVLDTYKLSPLDMSFFKTLVLFTKSLSKSEVISGIRSMTLDYPDREEHLRGYNDAQAQSSSSRTHMSESDSSDNHLNRVVRNQVLVSGSSKLGHIFRPLQYYRKFLGAYVTLGRLRVVAASFTGNTVTTEGKSLHLLEPIALAATLGVGFASIRAAKIYWNIDLLLPANITIPGAFLYLAQDQGFSNYELLVVWLYGVGLDSVWLKDKVLKFPRSAGLIGLLLPLLGFLSASQLIRYFPLLESRFDNQVVPTAILSLPTTVFWSLTWVATFERTGLANDLEIGAYNSHIFGFIKYIYNSFIVRMIDRAIELILCKFFGDRVPNSGSDAFGRLPLDVEAHPREFFPIPRNDPFQGPVDENLYRRESEEGFQDQWQNFPGHY